MDIKNEMRKLSKALLCLGLFVMATAAMAVPAKKEFVKVTQPDGTELTICLRGDEWCHFTTTADGYTVSKNEKGFYVYMQKSNDQLKATQIVAHDAGERNLTEQAFVAKTEKFLAPALSTDKAEMRDLVVKREQKKLAKRRAAQYDYNNFKGLIILVQYKDKAFSRDDYKEILTDMVNKEGYTGFKDSNGKQQNYTGSVCDYFSDNSDGKFKPHFDIAGPYTVNFNQLDAQGGYTGQESNYDRFASAKITNAAINAADKDIDFSEYDGDGDGAVDLVYFILAGNGANFSGNDKGLWWPHRSILFNPNSYTYIQKDGVRLYDYASSTELYGFTSQPSTIKIDGIGTICHEFSHVLGLPDFYDTDYQGSGGESNHPGDWSVMASGSYFNDARTPVGYSLFERVFVGFTDEPTVITEPGDYSLQPLYSSFTGYRLDTPEPKEYFLLENRQKNRFKWDANLPGSGMLVHRVDLTDPEVWFGGSKSNTVNCNPQHNYYEVVRADGSHTNYGTYVASAADVFPGSKNVRELGNSSSPASLKTWRGYNNKFGLSKISMNSNNGIITFTVSDYKPTLVKLNEELDLKIGMSKKLDLTIEPTYAVYSMTWESSNEKVATVDNEGIVTGVGQGTCTITATSDNGLKAICQVTVTPVDEYEMGAFKALTDGSDGMLKLNNAQVVYIYTKNNVTTAYLREETGALMLYNTNITANAGDLLNGSVFVVKKTVNNVPQADGQGATPTESQLTITKGNEVKPLEVAYEDLSPAHYSDLVKVNGIKLVRSNGIYAYSDQKEERTRIWAGNFGISSGIKSSANLDGKFYDVTAIYSTYLADDGEVHHEFNIVKAVEDVTNLVLGIHEIPTASPQNDSPVYNISGQRVGKDYKGIVIRNGKKTINR